MVYLRKEEILKVLGENLRSTRLALNISQQALADQSGISLKAVRNIEDGRNSSTESLVSYCRTVQKTDWIQHLAPPEIDDALFDRKEPSKRRLRAMPSRKEVRHV